MKNNNNEVERLLADFWNKRFANPEYVYGKEPNTFFKSVIDSLPPGKIFIPGAGEGRDAVYAASRGWEVYCTDISDEGRAKATRLAAEKHARILYDINDISDVIFATSSFDVIASVFFHLPRKKRIQFYNDSVKWLKPGGIFLLQAFTPLQLQYSSGGPKDLELLVTIKQLSSELKGLQAVRLEEHEVILNEGSHHSGAASVIEFISKKK
jgi:2-polyprenyl-3-methyl-5-hydroxy-6-metoxy-1,4-benzoquinol methylase